MDRYTPDLEMEEVGFGENIDDSQSSDIVILSDEERSHLMQLLDDKVKAIEGFSAPDIARLREVLVRNLEAFGSKQIPARMSNLVPIECHLKDPNAEIFCTPRWLGQNQMEFLKRRLLSMLTRNLLRKTFNPLYGCQAFVVPKPGKEKYRMVLDMRLLNKHTRRTSLLMPNLEQQVSFPKGSSIFGTFDILSGFYYLPVQEESRKYFTLVTHFGAFELCGSPQGWVNTPQLFQNRMLTEILEPIELFGTSKTGICQWIDDTLLYSTDMNSYLEALEKFLARMKEKRLLLNLEKCTFLGRETVWCGRYITAEGATQTSTLIAFSPCQSHLFSMSLRKCSISVHGYHQQYLIYHCYGDILQIWLTCS